MTPRALVRTPVTANDVSGPTTDDDVRRAQQGDVAAFERLYHSHAPAAHALARRMLGDESAARDTVQDIFVRAWERLASFRGESAFGTWLHRVGVNVILNQLRLTRRDVIRFSDDEPDANAPAVRPPDGGIDAQIDLEAAMARLPAGARMAFVLHDIEGYAHDEIATMLGLAPGTIRAQLWRARRQLMKHLDG
ncbi:MAG TPA: RNA polymerase sigma factor [Gemmatimonadaceae bacterium]|nr:RNA polymerase sigma factor [Gemmatimonadaceae bacterium]